MIQIRGPNLGVETLTRRLVINLRAPEIINRIGKQKTNELLHKMIKKKSNISLESLLFYVFRPAKYNQIKQRKKMNWSHLVHIYDQ